MVARGPCFGHGTVELREPLRIESLRCEVQYCFSVAEDDLLGVHPDVFVLLEKLAAAGVGKGRIEAIEARFGSAKRRWKVTQRPPRLTLSSVDS